MTRPWMGLLFVALVLDRIVDLAVFRPPVAIARVHEFTHAQRFMARIWLQERLYTVCS